MFGDKRRLAALTARYADLTRSWGAGTDAEQDAAARELVRIAKTAAPLDGGADLADRARHMAGSIPPTPPRCEHAGFWPGGRGTPTAPGTPGTLRPHPETVLKSAPRRVKRIQIDDEEPGDQKEA